MNNCTNCGQEVKPEEKNCPACGNEVITEIKQETTPKRTWLQILLRILGVYFMAMALFLFPIIAPLALEYALLTLGLLLLGIILFVFGFKKSKKQKLL